MLERSFILFGTYFLQAATCVVCLIIFLSLKREIQRLQRRVSCQDYALRLDAMNARLEASEARGSIPAPFIPRPSLNVSKRCQVVRLSKRGDPVETIAATLDLPRREVELLLKIQRLTNAAAAGQETTS